MGSRIEQFACARKSFQNDSYCPICHLCLNTGDVMEVNIGMSNNSLVDVLFQNALQNTSWDKIMENINKSSLAVTEVSQFMIEQLYFKTQHNNKDKNKLLGEVQAQNPRTVRFVALFSDSRLNDRHVDLGDRQKLSSGTTFVDVKTLGSDSAGSDSDK